MIRASRGRAWRQPSIIPGFGLTFGFSLAYLGLIVFVPLSTLFLNAAGIGWDKFWSELSNPRTLSAFRISFGMAVLAAAVNAVFGLLVAWVLVRYRFPGRRFIDSLIDLPFRCRRRSPGSPSPRSMPGTAGSAASWSRSASRWRSRRSASWSP